MIIISSGAYVVPEFQVELGRIPPCLLPLGNKRLIEYQIRLLKNSFLEEPIFVTLPDDYELSQSETRLFDDTGIEVIPVSSSLSLAQSLLYALSVVDVNYQGSILRVLYGDTLFKEITSLEENCIATGITNDGYDWHFESTLGAEQDMLSLGSAWAGYFSFSNIRHLIRCLAQARGSFIDVVNLYDERYAMRRHHFDGWLDLGHVNTYFQSRSKLTTERAFNKISIRENILYKTGEPIAKIQSEAMWFSSLPLEIKAYTPYLLDEGNDGGSYFYCLEYLSCLPLNEIFVHGKQSDFFWLNVVDKINGFLLKATQKSLSNNIQKEIESDFNSLISHKTYQRLNEYAQQNNFDLDHAFTINGVQIPSVKQITNICIDLVTAMPAMPAIIHGDLCFSNILYDSRLGQVKLIDPRGMSFDGKQTIYGDQKYDIAKLAHSIIGLYDLIIADCYLYSENNIYNVELHFELSKDLLSFQKKFKGSIINGVAVKDIMPIVVLLFLSMLPLHFDRPDRQKAMLANAARLFYDELT